jgi:hypothetical protein
MNTKRTKASRAGRRPMQGNILFADTTPRTITATFVREGTRYRLVSGAALMNSGTARRIDARNLHRELSNAVENRRLEVR